MSGSATSRVRVSDQLRTGVVGLRARPGRAMLSALGISLGIAAGVAILGISSTSRADLLARLGARANLLTASAGQTFDGSPAPLPATAQGMVATIPPVQTVSAVAYLDGATVRRTAAVSALNSGGITVYAAQPNLLATVGALVAHGTFLNQATIRYPAVVLGAQSAQSLGVTAVPIGTQVYLDGHYFTVIGVLDRVSIAPEIDDAALIGFPVAESVLGADGNPTELYLRSTADQVQAVADVLPFTVNPQQPEAVRVSRPSAILIARAAAGSTLTGLVIGIGAVSLLVAALGIANIMLISVLERRSEIGLRLSLGATKPHIATQFLIESVALASAGGLAGVAVGLAATSGYSILTNRATVVPMTFAGVSLCAAVLVGAIAGAYPALRAARLSPTDALRGI